MARRKKPEGETDDQTKERHIFETISNFPDRSDKTSWQRKMSNLEKLVAELKPIEDMILDLNTKKMEILDKITELRKDMVNNCLHPYEHLALKEGFVECKFCNRRMSIPNGFREEDNNL
jgi:predicted  nucleic acid-binding Zn-ribbon protein